METISASEYRSQIMQLSPLVGMRLYMQFEDGTKSEEAIFGCLANEVTFPEQASLPPGGAALFRFIEPSLDYDKVIALKVPDLHIKRQDKAWMQNLKELALSEFIKERNEKV